MSPIEVLLLANAPVPITKCQKCAAPFRPFMRGQVHRDTMSPLRALLALIGRGRPTSALICWECKEIVGYE